MVVLPDLDPSELPTHAGSLDVFSIDVSKNLTPAFGFLALDFGFEFLRHGTWPPGC